MDENAQQGRTVSREEYIPLRKIESLAQQVAQQSVRIADLETENDLLRRDIASQVENQASLQAVPTEDSGDQTESEIEADIEEASVSH